jgi:IS30 family transposase
VSHETIYRSLFVQARGVLKKELFQHLRSKRSIRRSRRMDLPADRRGKIANMVSIRDRPAAAEDRAVPGHWEGDLLSGSKNSYIATLVERHTRYVMLAKVDSKETQAVVCALIKQAKKLPNELYKSLTWDQGKELADHRQFTIATGLSEILCLRRVDHHEFTKRSLNMMANCVFASDHSRGGRFHSAAARLRHR